jgi:hypothetical protein
LVFAISAPPRPSKRRTRRGGRATAWARFPARPRATCRPFALGCQPSWRGAHPLGQFLHSRRDAPFCIRSSCAPLFVGEAVAPAAPQEEKLGSVTGTGCVGGPPGLCRSHSPIGEETWAALSRHASTDPNWNNARGETASSPVLHARWSPPGLPGRVIFAAAPGNRATEGKTLPDRGLSLAFQLRAGGARVHSART